MTDFDYEVRARKLLARQSRYRKCGSRTRYVALPSDGMTQKQWKEKNGKVVSYSMNKPMDWNQFRMISGEMQTDYIKRLQEDYGANAHMLSEMFGVSPFTVLEYCKKHKLGVTFPRGGRVSEMKAEAFKRFLSQPEEVVPQEEPEQECEETTDATEPTEKHTAVSSRSHISEFSVSFRGTSESLSEFYNMLRYMIPDGKDITLSVRCFVNDGNSLMF